MSYTNRRQWVLDQLALYSGVKKVAQDSHFILCPYHSERTPSGRIFHSIDSKSPGWFKCYGCGANVKWDEVAVKIGLKPFTKQRPADELLTIAPIDLKTDSKSFVQEDMQLSELPRGKLWRNIKT